MARRRGTVGDDTLSGKARDDRLFGLDGNDVLHGGFGNDVLHPGTGSDTLDGGLGDDIAVFTDVSYTGPDAFDGGRGNDTVDLSRIPVDQFSGLTYWDYDSQTGAYSVSQFNDPIDAPAGLTFTNVETLIGSRGDDLIVVVSSADDLTINAGGGNDWVRAGSGNTIVHAGSGDDMIDFGLGRIAFYGDTGDDAISVGSATGGLANGGNGVDTIGYGSVNLATGWALSGNGHRIAISQFENISLNGAQDGAEARGDENANVIDAGYWPSDFVLRGAGGADHVTGGDGADQLFGGAGDDVLDGAFGADALSGGQGADVFRFADDFFSRMVETDTVTDFHRGQGDKIDVSGIDADPNTFTDDALRFIGSRAFDGGLGELRYEVRGADTFVQIDRDGDAAADFEIRLAGAFSLHRSDFIFSADAGAQTHSAPMPVAELATP